jgi:hypothetical protein
MASTTDLQILDEIANSNAGVLTPDAVVAAAKDNQHPWHDRFDWDDHSAADKWRVSQARALIAMISVTRMTETRVLTCVGYVRDQDAAPSEQGYVAVARLMDDKQRARAALLAEAERVGSMVRRMMSMAAMLDYDHLVAPMVRSLDDFVLAVAAEQAGPPPPPPRGRSPGRPSARH